MHKRAKLIGMLKFACVSEQTEISGSQEVSVEIDINADLQLSATLYDSQGCIQDSLEAAIPKVKIVVDTRLPYGVFLFNTEKRDGADEKPPEEVAIEAETVCSASDNEKDDADVEKTTAEDVASSTAAETSSAESVPAGEKTETMPEEADDYEELVDSARKTKYSISAKLICIISLIVISALGLITTLVSYYVTNDVRISAEENNLTINSRTASDVENRLNTIYSNVNLLLDMLSVTELTESTARQTTSFSFERNKEVAAVIVPGTRHLVNSFFFISRAIDETSVDGYLQTEQQAVKRAGAGETVVLNASAYFGTPLMALLFPLQTTEAPLVVLFSSETLSDSLGIGSMNSSFMVNNEGYVLAHPESNLVLAAANMTNIPIVQEMITNSGENRQLLYTDEMGAEFFGAYL